VTAPSSPRVHLWLAGGAVVVLVLTGLWLVVSNLPGLLDGGGGDGRPAAGQSGTAGQAAATPGEARRINATLFFIAPSGIELVPVAREVPYAATTAGQARQIIETLLQPAPEGQTSAVPPGTFLRALYLTGRGEAFVDLSGDIVTAHPGGSLNESLTVYAIVNTLTVNLPEVSAVQILVDGHEVDTLNGHLDLRHPLARSLRWIQRGQ
jgi:hypothetical protein